MAKQGGLYWLLMTGRAFIVRDFLIQTSYKLHSLFKLLGVFFQILTFYFLARLVGGEATAAHLEAYGGDYFSFALVGIAFRDMFNSGLLTEFSGELRQQLAVGVFEAMCATPIRPARLMFFSLLWPVCGSLSKAFAYLLIGATLMGANISMARLPLTVVILLLCLVVFGSIGMIAGSLLLYFKRGDPVAWFLSSVTGLLGGAFFPVSILPDGLRWMSYVIPLPYALDALRASLIPTATLEGTSSNILALVVFAVVLLPLAWFATTKLFELSRREGGLGQY